MIAAPIECLRLYLGYSGNLLDKVNYVVVLKKCSLSFIHPCRFLISLAFGYCRFLYRLLCKSIWWLVNKFWNTKPAQSRRLFSVFCYFYRLHRVLLPFAGHLGSAVNSSRTRKLRLIWNVVRIKLWGATFLLLVTDFFFKRYINYKNYH